MKNFADFRLSSYDYPLPEGNIAQFPPEQRGSSRLMVLNRKTGENIKTTFSRLPEFLPEGSLLIANNSFVVPARLSGRKPSGARVEMLLLTPPPLLTAQALSGEQGWKHAQAEVLLKPGRSIRVGDILSFGEDINAEVLLKNEYGRHDVILFWRGDLVEIMKNIGHIPLPPYIKREERSDDAERYQTLYAKEEKAGSVAAPTAGLHFTESMRRSLAEHGFSWAEITLHVGYGTFSPVREDDIRKHEMHREYVEISPDVARAVKNAKKEGRPVVAVGTTSCRSLEGCFQLYGEIPEQGWYGWTNIFIYPGYTFSVVDHLITNFHLPKSSLLMLVASFCGRERILRAYAEAVESGYRFFSYGDAMLIL